MESCSVIFDVDGVLLDSLQPHLQICSDKNVEYGLGLTTPSPADFKKMVHAGVKISPMKFFFEAVGFPSAYAERATDQYNQVFMRDYAPKPFPGVPDMLSTLAGAGLHLGIATSNVRANVDAALRSSMRFFDPDCIYTKDHPGGGSKAAALRTAAARLNILTSLMIYVGDQPADWAAAKDAGVHFIGVSYGWGISDDSTGFPLASTVPAITKHVMSICAPRTQAGH